MSLSELIQKEVLIHYHNKERERDCGEGKGNGCWVSVSVGKESFLGSAHQNSSLLVTKSLLNLEEVKMLS